MVFLNPQSILCGMIAGLLFIPTTIFDMVWGVRYLQEARGLDYGSAVMRSSMVPLGWIIGCPLLGFISDRIGRRKPVIASGAVVLFACLVWILYGRANLFPPYVLGLVAGVASGAAMLPYTVIKEANPPTMSGTATGVVNFLNFTFSALLGPVFAWLLVTRQWRRHVDDARSLPDGVPAAALRRGAGARSHLHSQGNRTRGADRASASPGCTTRGNMTSRNRNRKVRAGTYRDAASPGPDPNGRCTPVRRNVAGRRLRGDGKPADHPDPRRS